MARTAVILLIIILFLVGCDSVQPSYVSIPAQTLTAIPLSEVQDNLNLQQTRNSLMIYDAQTKQAYNQSLMFGTQEANTRIAATITAQEPFNQLSIEGTKQTINATGTMQVIQAKGTEQAITSLITAEAQLAQDEINRLDNIRESEQIDIDYQRTYKTIYAVGLSVLFFVFGLLGMVLVFILWGWFKPIKFEMPDNTKVTVHPRLLDKLPVNLLPPTHERLSLPSGEEKPETKMLPALPSGHILIAGETGSGKTTAMLNVLKSRQNVVVLDPHDNTDTWGSFRVIGGGRRFDQIASYLQYMQTELQRRYKDRSKGKKEFEPLTVATDEIPAIVSEIGKDFGVVWRQWIREGRKVGLFIVVCTQSTRVKTLGIEGEGDVLENFNHIIELGKVAQSDFRELTSGMDRPAVIRSVDGVYPVIIPFTESISPQTNLPMITYANPENLTEEDREKILDMYSRGTSQRTIETEMFGFNGGSAWKAVKEVIENGE